jgi:hypothetical protein
VILTNVVKNTKGQKHQNVAMGLVTFSTNAQKSANDEPIVIQTHAGHRAARPAAFTLDPGQKVDFLTKF